MEKWSFAINEICSGIKCESKQDAINRAIKECKLMGIDEGEIIVGIIKEFNPYIDAISIIEGLQADADGEAGEFAKDYLDYVTQEDIDDLQKRMQETFEEWEKKHPEYKPSFFTMEAEDEFDIEEMLK